MDALLLELVAEASGAEGHPSAAANALADLLLDRGDEKGAAQVAAEGLQLLPKLSPEDWGDWKSAFAYAGEVGGSGHGSPDVRPAFPGLEIDCRPFNRRAVRRVVVSQEGEKDGDSWMCVGELWDGRFFALTAWCDYTGWG